MLKRRILCRYIINFINLETLEFLGKIYFMKTPTSLGQTCSRNMFLTLCQENKLIAFKIIVKSISRGTQTSTYYILLYLQDVTIHIYMGNHIINTILLAYHQNLRLSRIKGGSVYIHRVRVKGFAQLVLVKPSFQKGIELTTL